MDILNALLCQLTGSCCTGAACTGATNAAGGISGLTGFFSLICKLFGLGC